MNTDWLADGRKIPDDVMYFIRRMAVNAIRMLGQSPEKIAEAYNFDRSCIYRWLKQYDEGGFEALESKMPPVSEPLITSETDEWLKQMVLTYTPIEFGYETNLWTCTVLVSRHPFSIKAYCVACNKSTNMHGITWHFGSANAGGSIHPAWTETVVCECCGLNRRMRALLDFLLRRSERNFNKVYIAESIAPGYQVIKKLWPDVVGSEYLGTEYYSGEISNSSEFQEPVRHEDLTRLSFGNDEFDLVITQDVFEHISGYTNAFSECFRILSSSGLLVFTIPFFPANELTQIRASLKSDGSIEHHLPPEFHGNPVSNKGALCFQNFGWDILPTLTAIGFSDAKASMYWGPWQGHLGFPFFIFSAVKS